MASFTSDSTFINITDGSFTSLPNVVSILYCIGSENNLSSCSIGSPIIQTGVNFDIAKVSCSGKLALYSAEGL